MLHIKTLKFELKIELIELILALQILVMNWPNQ